MNIKANRENKSLHSCSLLSIIMITSVSINWPFESSVLTLSPTFNEPRLACVPSESVA